jgi:hypothetical protein
MHSRFRWATFGVLTLGTAGTRAQSAPAGAVAGVQVSVVIDSTGRAQVRERYRIPRDTGVLQLQHIRRACASVGDVMLSNYVGKFTLASTEHAPWIRLRDTTGNAYSADSSGFEISYTVALAASSVDIPLVQLSRPVPRREEDREGSVSLSVVTDGEVGFPRLTRRAPGVAWAGRFVAVPSFVRLKRTGGATTLPADCVGSAPNESSDGGLTWRFWTLVAIMVAWVPLYLAWARRAQDGEA